MNNNKALIDRIMVEGRYNRDVQLDHKGDPAKRPPECKIGEPGSWINANCPNLKEVGGGFSGEQYRCDVCGESYFLDYEEMR